nr:MAG TPA: hypothetical protein [Caudoviricetes sp.]
MPLIQSLEIYSIIISLSFVTFYDILYIFHCL